MNTFSKSMLLPGDCLLYRPSSIFGYAIALKTWCRFACHMEIYMGYGLSGASRDGLGVNTYALRIANLSRVLRPNRSFDFESYKRWHTTVIGQKYDWIGLLTYTLLVEKGAFHKMYCSEYGTRGYRAGGLKPFADHWDADKTPPSLFYSSATFDEVYSDE
jgi:hypothetical protein